MLVQLGRLKGGAHHDFGRGCVVQMSLETLPQGVELCARQAQLARQARRGLALGNSPEEEHQGRRALPGLRKDGPGEHRLVTMAGPTAIRRKMPLLTEQAPLRVPAMGASQPLRLEVTFQPKRADTVVEEFASWNVYHWSIISHLARWLHMSQTIYPLRFTITL